MDKQGYVYIMTNKPDGVLYIGVTSNLVKRVFEHRNGLVDGFTSKYNCKLLVYYEQFDDIRFAIAREKAMKKWNRSWKRRRINEMNPEWQDLWNDISSP